MPRYIAPEGCEGVSLMGVWHPVEADGCVTTPDERHDLLQNGFKVAPAAKPAKAAKPQPAKAAE